MAKISSEISKLAETRCTSSLSSKASIRFSMLWAWFHRDALRAKSGVSGMFSLWFPLLTTCVAAWIFLFPHFVGVSLATLWLYQPDLALVMTLAGVTGVVWAVFRLGVAYSGKRAAGPG